MVVQQPAAEAFDPIRASLWRSLLLGAIGTLLAIALAYWLALIRRKLRLTSGSKDELAAEYQTDREAYTDAKSAYVESVMLKASK